MKFQVCVCVRVTVHIHIHPLQNRFSNFFFFRLLSRAHVLRILNSWKNNPALSRKEAHISGNSNTGTFEIKETICLKHLYSNRFEWNTPKDLTFIRISGTCMHASQSFQIFVSKDWERGSSYCIWGNLKFFKSLTDLRLRTQRLKIIYYNSEKNSVSF